MYEDFRVQRIPVDKCRAQRFWNQDKPPVVVGFLCPVTGPMTCPVTGPVTGSINLLAKPRHSDSVPDTNCRQRGRGACGAAYR